jgi:ribosome modulation factor
MGRSEEEKRKSVKDWCDQTEPPTHWKGFSTAYRAGAKASAAGKDRSECQYGRRDLREAWLAGFDGMDGFLQSGGILLCDCCGQELKESEN